MLTPDGRWIDDVDESGLPMRPEDYPEVPAWHRSKSSLPYHMQQRVFFEIRRLRNVLDAEIPTVQPEDVGLDRFHLLDVYGELKP